MKASILFLICSFFCSLTEDTPGNVIYNETYDSQHKTLSIELKNAGDFPVSFFLLVDDFYVHRDSHLEVVLRDSLNKVVYVNNLFVAEPQFKGKLYGRHVLPAGETTKISHDLRKIRMYDDDKNVRKVSTRAMLIYGYKETEDGEYKHGRQVVYSEYDY